MNVLTVVIMVRKILKSVTVTTLSTVSDVDLGCRSFGVVVIYH